MLWGRKDRPLWRAEARRDGHRLGKAEAGRVGQIPEGRKHILREMQLLRCRPIFPRRRRAGGSRARPWRMRRVWLLPPALGGWHRQCPISPPRERGMVSLRRGGAERGAAASAAARGRRGCCAPRSAAGPGRVAGQGNGTPRGAGEGPARPGCVPVRGTGAPSGVRGGRGLVGVARAL